MSETRKTSAQFLDEINAKVSEINAAIKEDALGKTNQLEEELKELEKDYAHEKMTELFQVCEKQENPVKYALGIHSYEVISHKAVRRVKTGAIRRVEVSEKTKPIDLVRLFAFLGLNDDWKYKTQKFNQLLTLRAAKDLGIPASDLKQICDSYYMNDLARRVEMGETPSSNTAVCKQLQIILDGIIFEDDGNGANVYKANSHDVKYLDKCYSKRGKRALQVACANDKVMNLLILDIAHRVVTDGTYSVDFKKITEKSGVSEKKTTEGK